MGSLLSVLQPLPLQFGKLVDQGLEFLKVAQRLAYPCLPGLGDEQLTELPVAALDQVERLVQLAAGAMAGRLAATSMAHGEGAREQIWGQRELAEQGKFALAQPRSVRTLGLGIHLDVTILQEEAECQHNF